MQDPPSPGAALPLFQAHPRAFETNRYVYPVLSRRAGGISIGVNLNLDKVCNFDCVYCQVDRLHPGPREPIELARLTAELDAAAALVRSGAIYAHPQFHQTPPALRRLSDIAFSGDGEPTSCRQFDAVVAAAAEVRRRHALDDVKLVLITNASLLDRPWVRRGLEILDANHGEIWAKLDAGTEAYYRRVARSRIPLHRILGNLLLAARQRPIVIQSLFLRIRGEPPPAAEQEAYCRRLAEIIAAGGRIKLVQVHTIARPPAETWITPLVPAEVEAIAQLVRARTGLAAAAY